MLKKLILIAIVLVGLSQAKILFFNDISVEPIDKNSNPDFVRAQSPGSSEHRKGVYLISYADGHEVFFKNQNALTLSGLNKGIDFFLNYRRSHLDPDWVQKNEKILSLESGKGKWLWKPWIILKTLNTVPENAVVIYADTGFVFRGSVMALVESAQQNDIILTSYTPAIFKSSVEKHASRKILEMMNCDTPACRKEPHLWAGFLVLRNTPKSRAFIKQWLYYCSNPNILLNAVSDSRPPYPGYVNHMDDETVLAVLRAREPAGKSLLPAEELLEKYVTWHHRRYNKPLAQNNEYYSILPNMFKQIRGIERKIVNAYPIVKLRQWVLNHFSVIYYQKPKK